VNVTALILAAGEGTRMKSATPKVAHQILGVPMIRYVIRSAQAAGCDRVVAVTGHGAETVEALAGDVVCVRQERQLGTGHAVMCAREAVEQDGLLVVLSGDTPLLSAETIAGLVAVQETSGAAVTVLTTRLSDPSGYGRILRGRDGTVESIVEEKDCTAEQRRIDEVNTGTYCFDAGVLFAHLDRLTTDNAQGEYYLTDMISVFAAEGLMVAATESPDPLETLGVNSRVQLAEASKVLQRRINLHHMLGGVTMTDPDLVWVGPEVRLGRDVELLPMTMLFGSTAIEEGAVIGPNTRITDSTVGAGAHVDSSVLVEASVGPGAHVGPVAYLRPGAVLGDSAKAGACVEIKNSIVGANSKVPHLSYIGDTTIGEGVNVGAGSITCNYDGFNKHRTEIGDGAFIGTDTMLVAPVRVGQGAVTGAGSSIARDVPDGALAVERSEQKTFEGWAQRRRARKDDDQTAR
jgi:bifunctional UDP-N-acetylglucosamine pyrophosphorylase/glucosamine-1-phosphate N-acetyltransferase